MNMKEIAKIAKVSISTVSRVINDEPGVKAEVRERVKKVIEDTGYRPNQLARGLLKKKTNVIGVIVPVVHSYYTERINAITDVCNSCNYGTMISTTGLDSEQELKNFYLFYEKQVDGIIYSAHKITPEYQQTLEKMSQQIPIVMVDQEIKELNIPCVVHDSYDGAKKAVTHLIERGHTKLAFIGGPGEYDVNAEERYQGFRDVVQEQNITIPDTYLGKGEWSLSTGYREMLNILERSSSPPTALFTANDELAIGAMKAIIEKDFMIPDDISVVGYDGIYVADYLNPPLTTIQQDQYAIGIQATNLLLEYIQKQHVNIKKIVMDQTLVVRKSTRRI